MFNQLIRPRLRNFIPDVYRDVSYVLDEDGFSASEYQDTVRKRFTKAWDGIVDDFKVGFVPIAAFLPIVDSYLLR